MTRATSDWKIGLWKGVFGGATYAVAQPASVPSAPTPIQRAMQLLQTAMEQSVRALAAVDVRGLPKLLHAVHVAGDDTHTA